MSNLKKRLSIEEVEGGMAIKATGTGEDLIFMLAVLMQGVAKKVRVPLPVFGICITEAAKEADRILRDKDGIVDIDMSKLVRWMEKRGEG